MKKTSPFVLGALTVALWLAACAPVDLPSGGPAGPAPTPTTTPTTTPDPTTQAARDAAIKALADKLGVPVADITVIDQTPAEYTDACLGIAMPGMLCAQVITQGYRITLSANGLAYVYHVNHDGSVALENPARLIWNRTGGIAGVCQALEIVRDGAVSAGPCDAVGAVELTKAERTQLLEWLGKFGEVRFTAEDVSGPIPADGFEDDLYLVGTGIEIPTAADKQAMLDWAAQVYGRLTTPA